MLNSVAEKWQYVVGERIVKARHTKLHVQLRV